MVRQYFVSSINTKTQSGADTKCCQGSLDDQGEGSNLRRTTNA